MTATLPAGWVPHGARHVDVALATARFAPVFPCLPTKRPATGHGFKDATTDQAQIRSWWTWHPDHLVAIPTTGLLVVDLDEPDPPTGATWAWWCRFAEPHGWQPTTAPIVTTPSGGLHIYWKAPAGTTLRNTAGKLAPGIDTRGDGGYVIAPGSRLPDGRRYELVAPFPGTLPEAPGWLVDACTTTRPAVPATPAPDSPTTAGGTRYGLTALESELGRLAVATEGTRNDSLVRAAFRAGQLVAGGQLDAHDAHDKLHAVAIRIGLGNGETEATIESGMTAGAREPRRPAA